jgi:DNA-binding MarR family transcriptional regulator
MGGDVAPVDLRTHPGHLLRRAAQVHTVLWQQVASDEITSPQFAVLNGVAAQADIDQRTLGESVSLDRSTVADVVSRLVRRGLLERVRDAADGRRNNLRLTEAGRAAHADLVASTERMNQVLLATLDDTERAALLAALEKVVLAGENRSP